MRDVCHGKRGGTLHINYIRVEDLYTPKFFKAIINIDGTTHEALLKDAQIHPVAEEIFTGSHKLLQGIPVIVEIPIRVVGPVTEA